MFYSHQLLARKAPMGQIWMAATMHAKLSKRKLSKINIIQICDEILNPKVPMALRLSGILMGGVVIVYERKVKTLYDDVQRLLIELNEAWKVKLVHDPTILPKGKNKAKPEAVTLPNKPNVDIGEMEQSMDYSNYKTFAAINFQPSAYFTMNLDAVGELDEQLREEDLTHQQHQANLADITMDDLRGPYQTETAYTSFERFDVEGDEEAQMKFPSHEHIEVQLSPAPTARSPALPEELGRGFEMPIMQPESTLNEPPDEATNNRQNPFQEPQKKNTFKKKPRKQDSKTIIDNEHIVIPNNLYHSWLQESSDIVSKRRRIKKNAKPESSLKINLPNVGLPLNMLGNRNSDYYFPMQLRELWTKSFPLSLYSPSGRTSGRNARTEPSIPSPQWSGQRFQDPQNNFDGGHSGFTSGSNASMEAQRAVPPMEANFVPPENIVGIGSVHNTSPNHLGNDLTTMLSQASLGSVHKSLGNNSDGNSTRSGKKRPHTESHNNTSGLKTVVEDTIIDAYIEHEPNFFINEELHEPNFNLARPSQKRLTPENAYNYMTPLMEETGRTQTQLPPVDEDMENTTIIIRTHLKSYFEDPDASPTESLEQLADGMNRKQAAHLFYQTCVLATKEFLKVKQTVPYGDILISRGAKM